MSSTDNNLKASGRLGTQFRGKLAQAYGKRGHQKSALWYAYSSRTKSDWVLKGALGWIHFLQMESDPSVRDIDYAPDPVVVAGINNTNTTIELQAIVTRLDNTTEWHQTKYSLPSDNADYDFLSDMQSAANAKGARFVQWTEKELYENPQRIANWWRVNGWLAAVRDRPLSQYQSEIASLLAVHRSIILGDVKVLSGITNFPLYAASVFRSIQLGDLISNLDDRPLSRFTTICAADR